MNITYPTCILPFHLDYYKDSKPELPAKPNPPTKNLPIVPHKPYHLTEKKKPGSIFWNFIGMILFNGFMIFVAIETGAVWVWIFYAFAFLGLIYMLFSGELKSNNETKQKETKEYYKKCKEYDELVKITERTFKEEQIIYENDLKKYSEKVKVLQSDLTILNHRKNKKREFFRQAKRPTVSTEQYKKGVTEDFFLTFLKKYFGSKVKTNMTIRDDDWHEESRLYLPDYVYFDPDTISIDIEIDEPYIGKTGEPIHFLGSENNRDEFFQNNNWIVIRFAEEQIIKEPANCCYFIAQVIFEYTDDNLYLLRFSNQTNPTQIRQWTKDEAHKLAFSRYRNKYLNRKLQEELKDEINLTII